MKKKSTIMPWIAMCSVAVALLVFLNLMRETKMLTLLSHESEACIVCHPMNTLYATWQHSSHRNGTVCIDSFVSFFCTLKPSIENFWVLTL